MRTSVVSVFLMDVRQGFRDRENTTIPDIKRWANELGVEVFEEVSLSGNQFRCAGSKEYVEWIDELFDVVRRDSDSASRSTQSLENEATAYETRVDEDRAAAEAPQAPYGALAQGKSNRFFPLEIKLCNSPFDLEAALHEQMIKGNTVRLLASYGREWKTEGVAIPHSLPPHLMDFNEAISLGGETRTWSKIWNFVPDGSDYTHFIQARPGSKMSEDPLCEVGCPYVVRGFDFDYVGLLWLSDLKWRSGKWIVDTDHVFERGVKRLLSAARNEVDESGAKHVALLRAIQEAYRILLTRPLKGLFVWCEDRETRAHLASALRIA
jgi:hypothetical protein